LHPLLSALALTVAPFFTYLCTVKKDDMDNLEIMRSGAWNYGMNPEVSAALEVCAEKCFRLNSLPPSARGERNEIIKDLLGGIEEPFVIHSPFRCDFGSQIHIGRNFIGNFNLVILDEASVTIGDHVFIGPNVSLYTVTHALLPEQRNDGVMRSRPIIIEDNVWICGSVVILPGVTVGVGAVVGAGSVVTHDIPAGMLAAGNPCRVLRPIVETDRVTGIAGCLCFPR